MKLKRYPADYNPVLEYWNGITDGSIVVSQKIYKTYRHVVEQLNAKDGEFFYSPKRANHVIEFVENFCHHSKGKVGGQLVQLELWEKAMLATVFGFVDIEGNRQYREAVLIVGKKNGKSLIASAVGNYMMLGDGEAGPEVYAVATKKDQAKSSGLKLSAWSRSLRRFQSVYVLWLLNSIPISMTAYSSRWHLTVIRLTA